MQLTRSEKEVIAEGWLYDWLVLAFIGRIFSAFTDIKTEFMISGGTEIINVDKFLLDNF